MLKTISRTVYSVALSIAFAAGATWADGGGGGGGGSGFERKWGGRMDEVNTAIESKDYQGAISQLESMRKEDPEDADVLNLLGFSHRQMQDYDSALTFYEAALKIDPEHLGANEYLGELYLQTGELAKAEERLEVLDDACFFGCDEFDKLEEAIEKYKAGSG